MIPVEKKSELLLREDRPKVIIYEFFNTIAPDWTLPAQMEQRRGRVKPPFGLFKPK
jgi:hypothetical protein